MSDILLRDGLGRGYAAEVNSDRRLKTFSISRTELEQATNNGDAYSFTTGPITLTGNATESAVHYLKTNETRKSLAIKGIFFHIGNSTGGSGDWNIKIFRNPTTGTIISTATDLDILGVNKNYGSTKVVDVDGYKGFEGATFTNGDLNIFTIGGSTPARIPLQIDTIILEPGSSMGISIVTQSGNSSMAVSVAVTGHLEEVN